MRRRAKRDLATLLGVVLIVVGIVTVNIYLRLEGMKDMYRSMRVALEEKYRGKGYEVLDWDTLRTTTGSYRRGPTFDTPVKNLDGKLVNLCGFMSPIDQFRNVTSFMLLPTPITCYFCDAPPMRDVVEVKLLNPTDMVEEPIIIAGRLEVHEGPKPLFFYTIKDALWNQAVKDENEYKELVTSTTHKLHLIDGFEKLRSGDTDEPALVPGQEPPKSEVPGGGDLFPKMEKRIGGHAPNVDMGDLLPPQKEAAPEGAGAGDSSDTPAQE